MHITSSGYGIRIVFTADINEGNLADNQIVFAQRLGYQPDESCIDATRNSFAPKEEDILYINEELLFDYNNEEFDKKYTPMYREKKTQPINYKFPSDSGTDSHSSLPAPVAASAPSQQGSAPVGQVDAESVGDSVKWHGYDIQGIIDQRYADKLPCADDSNRHKESLKLATDLLLMLDGDKVKVQRIIEAQSWVQEIINERDENVAQTVESAAGCVAEKEKKYASSLPSKSMLKAIEESTGKNYQEIVNGGDGQQGVNALYGQHKIQQMLLGWGEEIEALFPDFPLLKDICEGLKKSQYPAALFVGGGTAMTLMTRTWYRFYLQATSPWRRILLKSSRHL